LFPAGSKGKAEQYYKINFMIGAMRHFFKQRIVNVVVVVVVWCLVVIARWLRSMKLIVLRPDYYLDW